MGMRIGLLGVVLFAVCCVVAGSVPGMPVRGRVVCATDGRPLKDVWVGVRGAAGTAVLTGVDGAFVLPMPSDSGRSLVFDKPGFVVAERLLGSNEVLPVEVKLVPAKTSAATARWNRYLESEDAFQTLEFNEQPEWALDFEQHDLTGCFAEDPTMVRRDPSAVIQLDGWFYVYYTRGKRFGEGGEKKSYPWDRCDIWCARSKDGWDWSELGPAVVRGPAGSFDERSAFTPEVLAHDGKYYLVYQAVTSPYNDLTFNVVGMAVADSPEGPWKKLAEPILRPTPNGIWKQTGTDKRIALRRGAFDSHKVHDPCLLFYRNKFYLYYKGQRVGEHRFFGQREIRWGVAVADKPEGPYVKSVYNPITTTGHEVCVWPCKGGIALLHTLDGPEAKTVQWAADGINFELMSTVRHPPEAPGLFRILEPGDDPRAGIRWGLCHVYGAGDWRTSWNVIRRFDLLEK